MPVVIAEPELMGVLACFAVVFCLPDDAAKAVDDEKRSGGEEEKSDKPDEPVWCVLRATHIVECSRFDE